MTKKDFYTQQLARLFSQPEAVVSRNLRHTAMMNSPELLAEMPTDAAARFEPLTLPQLYCELSVVLSGFGMELAKLQTTIRDDARRNPINVTYYPKPY